MASKRKKAAKLPKPVMAWAGVVDGRIYAWDGAFDCFTRRTYAMHRYEQVQRVRIVPVRGGKRG